MKVRERKAKEEFAIRLGETLRLKEAQSFWLKAEEEKKEKKLPLRIEGTKRHKGKKARRSKKRIRKRRAL